jgi:hypothetical protein
MLQANPLSAYLLAEKKGSALVNPDDAIPFAGDRMTPAEFAGIISV